MRYLLLLSIVLLCSCRSLQKNESYLVQDRILGLNCSIPIPFLDNLYFFRMQLGWVEKTYSHNRNSNIILYAHQKVNYLGEVGRLTKIKNNKKISNGEK